MRVYGTCPFYASRGVWLGMARFYPEEERKIHKCSSHGWALLTGTSVEHTCDKAEWSLGTVRAKNAV